MLEKYWVGGFFFGIWTYKRGAPTKYNGKWFILDGLALHISAKPQVQNNIAIFSVVVFFPSNSPSRKSTINASNKTSKGRKHPRGTAAS